MYNYDNSRYKNEPQDASICVPRRHHVRLGDVVEGTHLVLITEKVSNRHEGTNILKDKLKDMSKFISTQKYNCMMTRAVLSLVVRVAFALQFLPSWRPAEWHGIATWLKLKEPC